MYLFVNQVCDGESQTVLDCFSIIWVLALLSLCSEKNPSIFVCVRVAAAHCSSNKSWLLHTQLTVQAVESLGCENAQGFITVVPARQNKFGRDERMQISFLSVFQ